MNTRLDSLWQCIRHHSVDAAVLVLSALIGVGPLFEHSKIEPMLVVLFAVLALLTTSAFAIGRVAKPWKYLFLLPLLYGGASLEGREGQFYVAAYPAVLVVPLAALLGARFHRAGLLVLAAGGVAWLLPFLLQVHQEPWHLFFLNSASLYPLALAVGAAAASPTAVFKTARKIAHSKYSIALLPVIPLVVGFTGDDGATYIGKAGDIRVALIIDFGFEFDLSLAFSIYLFLLGIGRAKATAVLGVCGVAALCGFAIRTWAPQLVQQEFPLDGAGGATLYATYYLTNAGAFLGAWLNFQAGKLFAAIAEGRLEKLLWYQRYGILIVAATTAVAGHYRDWLGPTLDSLVPVSGSVELASLLAGLVLSRGSIIPMLVLMGVSLTWPLSSELSVTDLLRTVSFSALGLAMRHAVLHGSTEPQWLSRRIPYPFLLLVASALIIEAVRANNLRYLMIEATCTVVAMASVRQSLLRFSALRVWSFMVLSSALVTSSYVVANDDVLRTILVIWAFSLLVVAAHDFTTSTPPAQPLR